jgi:signal transduction histidine kinase/DNA-binding response OmpR family regulator
MLLLLATSSLFVVVGAVLVACHRQLRARERELERRTRELAASRVSEQWLAIEIQEVRRTEEESRQAKASAEAANRAKSMFLANMSHELRTPLNSMLGFAQLMERDRSLGDQHRENLAVISKSGEHLLGLVNDILEMAKIEAGRMTLTESDFDLHGLLFGIEEMIAVQAKKKDLSLVFEREPGVPRHVHTDEGKLRQVLLNLLANALKFTSKGRITVRAWARMLTGAHKGVGQAWVRLSFEVADTGRGMAQEEVGALFEAFTQTESGRQSLEGTGLGLHISREFVRMMGGDIRVESELGRGSTFRFDVRVSLADARERASVPPARKVVGLTPGQPKYRILVVDDRWDTRHLLLKLIESVGFEVRSATNGLGALAQWETWSPHLVLMDLRMPLLDGYDATRTIKASPRGRETVVVAMTASAFEHNRSLVLAAGCDDFLSKPFRDSDIFDLLEKHIGARFRYEEQSGGTPAAPPAQTEDLARAAAALPGALRKDLRQAATRLDAKAVQAAIERIRPHDALLATAVAELARAYRFDTMLALSGADEEDPS